MVIGQAPGRTDHNTGALYSGPAGNRLRRWFDEAGFAPEDFGTSIYLTAITRCFPGRKPGSSTDRVPSRAEQAFCREWLDAEIALVQPRVIVLFGALAIRTFLHPAPLRELIGKTFRSDGVLYLPLPHSSGASTWLHDPAHRELLTEAIQRLRESRVDLMRATPPQGGESDALECIETVATEP